MYWFFPLEEEAPLAGRGIYWENKHDGFNDHSLGNTVHVNTDVWGIWAMYDIWTMCWHWFELCADVEMRADIEVCSIVGTIVKISLEWPFEKVDFHWRHWGLFALEPVYVLEAELLVLDCHLSVGVAAVAGPACSVLLDVLVGEVLLLAPAGVVAVESLVFQRCDFGPFGLGD